MPTVLLTVALVLTGLLAGLYLAFTTAVMPGLARADARTYVTAMQRIDESIQNPWFLSAFTGAFLAAVAAAFTHLGDDARSRLPWIIAGAVLYGVTIVTTAVVNIPLNRRLAAAGDVDERAAAAVREIYHDRWCRFNDLRTALATAATIVLATALAQPLA